MSSAAYTMIPTGSVARFPCADTRTQRKWRVLQTRSRHEKCVAEALAQRNLVHYLPLVDVQHTYTKRRVTFQVPRFAGYVFMFGDDAAREYAQRMHRVANILEVFDQEQFRHEIEQVRRAIDSGQTVELYPALKPGERCRIVAGPLSGLEGTVVRHGQRCEMFLSVTILGQSASMQVDGSLLEPAPEEAA